MALSPSIPTSFVPKQPVSTGKHHYSSGSNIFLVIASIFLGIALLGSAAVFFYAQYLDGVMKAKSSQLVAAQNNVSQNTVDQFVRLHDRFAAAKQLINEHVELSQFFTLLESITIQNVHFSTLQVTVADDRSAQITMSGQAKTFNALAAESNLFAQQPNIKSAIFSGISVNNKDNSISFGLSATLSPNIVVESTAPSTPALLPGPSASSSPVSSLSVTTTSSTTTTNASTSGNVAPQAPAAPSNATTTTP